MSRLTPGPVRAAGLSFALAVWAVLALPMTVQAQTQTATALTTQSVAYDIPAQPLSSALTEFARQSDQELFYLPEMAEGKSTAGASGSMTAEQAITELLRGTGLEFEIAPTGALLIGDADALTELRRELEARGRPDPSNGGALYDPNVDLGENRSGQSTTASVETIRREGGIDEIIVTARRREESIQDVPISITALSSEDMKAFGIRNLADMEGIVPGLNMGGGGNGVKKDSNPFIRGIGQRETKVTLDPGVGTYIDGIYIARTGGALLDTVGVESIEVLRGPQGTLFGRNTTGGAIAITTQKPENAWSAQIGANVGNYGRSDVTGVVNVPIIKDALLGRLTVSSKNSKGYFTNINDNTIWGGDNRLTGIMQLRWLPAETATVDLLAERSRIRETPRPQKCAQARPVFVTGGDNPPNALDSLPVIYTDNARRTRGEPNFNQLCAQSAELPNDEFASDYSVNSELFEQGRYWVDTATVGLTTTWEIGRLGPMENTQFKSITAWRRVEQIADEDLDGVGAGYLLRIQPDFDENNQYSQEFQFTGSALDQRLFFSTGLYYFQEETPANDLSRAAGLSYGQYGDDFYLVTAQEPTWERLETDNQSFAWFGQVDFDITSQFQISAGIRYTREERWSRYSKGYSTIGSMILNPEDVEDSNDLILPCKTSCSFEMVNAPIFAPLDEWDFQGKISTDTSPLRDIPGDELSVTDSAWTPMVSLKYRFGEGLLESLRLDEAMLYVTYSEGFHAGGVTSGATEDDSPGQAAETRFAYAGDPLPDGSVCQSTPCFYQVEYVAPEAGWGVEDPVTFEPEHVKNYEIGLKMQGFDRRFQSNIALYYMDYTDMQVTSVGLRIGLPIPFVDNVGRSAIQGVEAEFVIQPTAKWRILSNIAYTDADMKEWNALIYDLHSTTGAVIGTSFEARDDEPMPRVPEWQAFLLTDYSFDLRGGSILAPSISVRYTSEIYHGFDRGSYLYAEDIVTSDEVAFVDARIPWVSADGKMEIAAWVKNLTNIDDYLVGGIPLVDVTGAMGQVYANPRTFGLNMTYNFGI